MAPVLLSTYRDWSHEHHPCPVLMTSSTVVWIEDRTTVSVRWVARIWGTSAALLWGAFFIEHLAWFKPSAGLPPLRVWLLQAVHFTMIAALFSAWRYERAGGMVALCASIVFFAAVGGSRLWQFLAITAPPAIAFIYCASRASRKPSAPARPARRRTRGAGGKPADG